MFSNNRIQFAIKTKQLTYKMKGFFEKFHYSFPKSNLTFSQCIKPVHYFFKIFGMSYVEYSGWVQFILEVVYIIIQFSMYLAFVYNYEVWYLTNYPKFFKLEVLITLTAFQTSLIVPSLCFVKMKFKNKELRRMIFEVENICDNDTALKNIEFSIIGSAGFVGAVAFMGLWIYVQISYISNYTENFEISLKHTFRILLDFWIFSPLVQFVCWTILIRVLYAKVVKQMNEDIVQWSYLAKRVNSEQDMQLKRYIRTLKRLLSFKSRLTKTYGLCVALFIFNSTIFMVYGVLVAVFRFYKPQYYLIFARYLTFFGFTLMGLFWSSESFTYKVKRSLSMVHNLIVTHQWPLRDKRLRNFSLSLLHEDLTFRVCDLLDLTYNQLLSITSIAVAFLVIQLQLQM